MGLSNSEVAHRWANQTQERGRGSSFFFEGPKLYSFGHHFCVARILPDKTVVFGLHRWSGSYTSRHQNHARTAIRNRRIVYCDDPDAPAAVNMSVARRTIQSIIEDGDRARRFKELAKLSARNQAMRIAEQANEYLKALPENERKGVDEIEVEHLKFSPEESRRYAELSEETDRKRRERDEARARIARETAADRLLYWRGYEYHGVVHGAPPALRLSKDGKDVQTSWGAAIPVTHAKRLWPLILNCKTVGKPLEREMKVGLYTLTVINADGSIKVGCHDIAFKEIEAIADQLGLLREEETT